MRYVHLPIDEEIRSVGGYYKILKEGVFEFKGKKVIYVLKAAHVDTSCCGAGGLGFISVPGFLMSYKSEKNENGLPVSEVKKILDEDDRKSIRNELLKKYPYISVVDFG